MILFVLLIGVVLIVAAVRNSQGALFAALGQDVPEFVIWAAAILALGVIGYVPDLKPVSRALLALVIIVIVLQNYKNVVAGFQAAWTEPPQTQVVSPMSQSSSGSSSGGGAAAGDTSSIIQNAFGSNDGASGFGSSGLTSGATDANGESAIANAGASG